MPYSHPTIDLSGIIYAHATKGQITHSISLQALPKLYLQVDQDEDKNKKTVEGSDVGSL